jgi:hypothetical protein
MRDKEKNKEIKELIEFIIFRKQLLVISTAQGN